MSTAVRRSPLTDDELKQYQQQGWVILGRVVDDRTLEALRAEEARFRPSLDPLAKPERTVFRSQLCNFSQVIRDFACGGPHLPLVCQLIGPNVCLWWNQLVTKLPDAHTGKSEFPWHQDNGYVAIEPATNVTVWVALDDVDERNGCVWVVPGSHRRGLLPHRAKGEDSWHLTVPVEGDGVPARLPAGHAVAFAGLTLHRSKLNHSDKPRRAFFMEYADAAAKYSRDLKQWVPVVASPDSWLVSGQLPRSA